MQRLLLPFKRGMIICGYKTAKYRSYWGYQHYGIDVSSIQGIRQADNYVRASGEGVVVWKKYDYPGANAKSLGWALAVRYDDCISHGGTVKSLVVRYMHSPTCYVELGQKVHADDKLLLEGKVGTTGEHSHIEMDVDTRYPQYTPQVSVGHSGWLGPDKGAEDSTVNPSYWLWQDTAHQQEPYLSDWNTEWINDEDVALPFVPAENNADLLARIAALEKEYAAVQARNAALEKEYAAVQARNAALEKEYAAVQARNAALEKEYAAVQARNAALEKDKAELLATLDKARAYGRQISVL